MTKAYELAQTVTDKYCEKLINTLRRMHREGHQWMNAKEITEAQGTQSNTHVEAGMYKLAAMGFLNMRDGDGKAKFEYQLRPEYRK